MTTQPTPTPAPFEDLYNAASEILSEWPLSGLSDTDRAELVDALRAAVARVDEEYGRRARGLIAAAPRMLEILREVFSLHNGEWFYSSTAASKACDRVGALLREIHGEN